MGFVCDKCKVSFSRKHSLIRHIVTHTSEKENRKIKRIICAMCPASLKNYALYHHHLDVMHHVNTTMKSLQFTNFQEFQIWKVNFEKSTLSTFVQTSSARKVKNGCSYYFYCHRSFLGKTHKRKTTNKKKQAGTNKINVSCPAMMKATVRNEAVKVEYCSTHLSHKCDIGRLRLSKEERNLLAEKLSAGVPPRCILADIKQEAPPTSDRIRYVNMNDLRNIKKSYKINCPPRYDKIERISTESSICKKLSLGVISPVLFYKNQDTEYENFEKSDFIMIIMTDFQREMMMQFGEQMICIDATRGLNDYNLQLYTLLVLDEFHEGIPVAFCFSNKDTKELYKLFFAEVKKSINKSIKPYVFMSNGEATFYEAWVEIMSAAELQLICRCHLVKRWVTSLKKHTNTEKRRLILQTLNALMMEEDINTFETSFDHFLIRLQEDEETVSFYQYFIKNYRNNVHLWAQCYRPFVPVQANISMESHRKNIQYKYNDLNGTRSIELDKTIYALLCYIQDKLFERLVKFAQEEPSIKLQKIKEIHEKSTECDENVEELGNNEWSVRSSTNYLQKYDVRLLMCEPCCVHICKKCKICFHMLTCSCSDNAVKQNICKHIHAVMRLQQDKKSDTVYQEFLNSVFRPIKECNDLSIEQIEEHLITYDSEDQSNTEMSRLLTKTSVIYSTLKNTALNSEQYSKVLKYLDVIAEELSTAPKVIRLISTMSEI